MKENQQEPSGLLERFAGWKQEILEVLVTASEKRDNAFGSVHRLGSDALERIVDFSKGGKMLRGGLVCLANGLVGGEVATDAFRAGAAVELFQSALLIHDDIMDRDLRRRGAPSVFNQYQDMAQRSYVDDFYHLGESLGICAGDIAFFLGFELLTEMTAQPPECTSLFAKCAQELCYVGVAQMADVLRGASGSQVSPETPLGRLLESDDAEKAVLDVYKFKTGRYTFSLPLMMGAVIAGADENILAQLEQLGEDLGILFQLKDDEIGIFGSEAETGKPVGSDIREGKKTLFYVYMLESTDGVEKERFLRQFGGPEIGDEAMSGLIESMEALGVRKRVMEKAAQLAGSAREIIDRLKDLNPEYISLLHELVDYNLNRTR